MSFYRAAADGLRLRLKVKPQARRDGVEGVAPDVEGEALVVSVTAPPEGGKANAAVIALLAKTWDVPRGDISVVQGATARRKLIAIAGDAAVLAARIEAWRSRKLGAPEPSRASSLSTKRDASPE